MHKIKDEATINRIEKQYNYIILNSIFLIPY